MSQQESYRFGDSTNAQRTLYAVKIPFITNVEKNPDTVFDVLFNVIKGKLPALIGLPTLWAMKSKINFGKLNFGLSIGKSYKRFESRLYGAHVALPFKLYLARRPSHTACHLTTQLKKAAATTWFTTSCSNQQRPNDSPIQLSQHHRNHVPTPSATEDIDSSAVTHVFSSAYNLMQNYTLTNQVSNSNPIRSTDLSLRDLKQIHIHLHHGSKTTIQEYLRSAGQWSS